VLVYDKGDSNVPQTAKRPTPGTSAVAWQDDRTGVFNTWYARRTDGGTS
jgi:hypothetical protein